MIGLLGAGRTGSHLLEQGSKEEWRVFRREDPPQMDSLQACEAAIIFLPPRALDEYLGLLLESRVPVICGTTGFEYPKNFQRLLVDRNQVWVHANNFSPAMSVVKVLLSQLGKSLNLLNDFVPQITETHHINKLDAPSGTALRWQEWLGSEKDIEIDSIREGDVIGIHKLLLESELEKIELIHESKDRGLFARGALLALKFLREGNIRAGFHRFESIIEKEIRC